jgi:hypothetical protein
MGSEIRAVGVGMVEHGASFAKAGKGLPVRWTLLWSLQTQGRTHGVAIISRGYSGAATKPHAPAMIDFKNATWRANAARPCALALTVVRGLRSTKALVTST